MNLDPARVLLAQRTENKTLEQQLFLYTRGAAFLDRREAIEAAMRKQDDPSAQAIIKLALADKYAPLRELAVSRTDLKKDAVRSFAQPLILAMASQDRSRPVKAAAIQKISDLNLQEALPVYRKALNDSSYSVAGAALDALSKMDSVGALAEAKRLSSQKTKGRLANSITRILIQSGDESSAEMIISNFEDMPLSQAKFEGLAPLAEFLGEVRSMEYLKRGVDAIAGLVNQLPEEYRGQIRPYVENVLRTVQKSHTAAGRTEHAAYIENKLSKKDF
jgi:aminopeptidase N